MFSGRVNAYVFVQWLLSFGPYLILEVLVCLIELKAQEKMATGGNRTFPTGGKSCVDPLHLEGWQ